MKFTKDNIILNSLATTKEELLKEIAQYAKEKNYIDNVDNIYQAFLTREAEYSTGLQDGFAIPHAKALSVTTATVLYVRTNQVLDWETFDDGGVTDVFALLVPKKEEGTVHIKMLSQLATALLEDSFKEELKATNDVKKIVNIINLGMNEEE